MGGCATQSSSENQQDSTLQQSVEQNEAAEKEASEAGISYRRTVFLRQMLFPNLRIPRL